MLQRITKTSRHTQVQENQSYQLTIIQKCFLPPEPAEGSGLEQQVAEGELVRVPLNRLRVVPGITPSTCTSQISIKHKDQAAVVCGVNARRHGYQTFWFRATAVRGRIAEQLQTGNRPAEKGGE
jgi:hypothetical protein